MALVEDIAEFEEQLVGVGLGVFHEAEALAGEAVERSFMRNSDWGSSVPLGVTSLRRLDSAVVMGYLRGCENDTG